MRGLWYALGVLILAQIGYPLTHGTVRAALVLGTVTLGFLVSAVHATLTRGVRPAAILVLVAAGGGLAVEALGVATGVPFGRYHYGDALGPKLLGVPLIIPLAWAWMAWPAWLVSGRLCPPRIPVPVRVVVAGWALATWDLFLDPQMVAEGYWTWQRPRPALPGIPGVPAGNFAGWLAVAVAMMAVLAVTVRWSGRQVPVGRDAPMYALYLWTYVSSVLAGLVFLDLPGAAAWVGAGMGLIAVPLAALLAVAQRATPDATASGATATARDTVPAEVATAPGPAEVATAPGPAEGATAPGPAEGATAPGPAPPRSG